MSSGRIFIAFFLLIIMSFPAYAEETAPEGVYIRLPDREFTFDGKKVEIVKFLSFYCGHCYQFEKQVPVIDGNFPRKIRWNIVPIYWGKGSSKPGEAYILAKEAGKGEEMKRAIYRAHFDDKKDIGSIEVLEDIGIEVGLGFDFSRRLRTGEKKKDVDAALALASTYGIEETPTLIIAGNLMTAPGAFKGIREYRDNVITILRGLFGK